MHSRTLILLLLLALMPSVVAEEYIFDSSLYSAERLDLEIDITNAIALQGDVRTLEARVAYFPQERRSQNVRGAQTSPGAEEQDGTLIFRWERPQGSVSLSYEALVESAYDKPVITKAVPFPYRYVPPEHAQYLGEQEIIIITPEIQKQAQEIIGNEDDAVRAVFLLGTWVKDNIEYDLNTVTAEASQTSQWVLDNRYGVCDELTSLFIAMVRSQGIPARFVSGVAYTNLEGYDDHWGPHGWAEVWYPEVGWVPYDVTYGQYGYVDATHITFQHSADARTNAAEYSMTSQGGSFEPASLERTVRLVSRRGTMEDPFTMTVSAALDEVGFGSYNRVDATVKNLRGEYVAAELFLADTQGLSVEDRSRSLLLEPGEERDVHWLVRVDDDLETGFQYTFPIAVMTTLNSSTSGSFSVRSTGIIAGHDDLAIPEEPAVKPLQGALSCENPERVRQGEPFIISCTFERPVRLCLTDCVTGTSITEEFSIEELGVHTIIAKAQDGIRAQRQPLLVQVIDDARLNVTLEAPATILASAEESLRIRITPESISDPENVRVTLTHPLFSQSWDLGTLERPTTLEVRFTGAHLTAGPNELRVRADWADGADQHSSSAIAHITPIPEGFSERMVLWANSVAAWFSSL